MIALAKLPPTPDPKTIDPKRRRRALLAVWLRDIEGHTIRETAEVMGVSPRTVVKAQADGRELVHPLVREKLRLLVGAIDAQDPEDRDHAPDRAG